MGIEIHRSRSHFDRRFSQTHTDLLFSFKNMSGTCVIAVITNFMNKGPYPEAKKRIITNENEKKNLSTFLKSKNVTHFSRNDRII